MASFRIILNRTLPAPISNNGGPIGGPRGGIRSCVSRILLGETWSRVGCIPLSKGYRANLNIGRSAVPSGRIFLETVLHQPVTPFVRSCDPF